MLRKKWKQHVNDEPWELTLLAIFGAEAPRIKRDSVFCAGVEIVCGHLLGGGLRGINDRAEIDAAVEQLVVAYESVLQIAEASLKKSKMEFDEFVGAVSVLQRIKLGEEGITCESVQSA